MRTFHTLLTIGGDVVIRVNLPDFYPMYRCEKNMKFILLCWNQIFFFFSILRAQLWHMEVSKLGDESELQLLAFTIATATPDPSHVSDLHWNLWQCQILYWARPRIKPSSSWILIEFLTCSATIGTPEIRLKKKKSICTMI